MKNIQGTTDNLELFHENGKMSYHFYKYQCGYSYESTFDERGMELTFKDSGGKTRGFDDPNAYGMNTQMRTTTGCASTPLGVKQSSIDWLMNQALAWSKNTKTGCHHIEFPSEAFNQAKAMHKEEIAAAYKKGVNSCRKTSNIGTP